MSACVSILQWYKRRPVVVCFSTPIHCSETTFSDVIYSVAMSFPRPAGRSTNNSMFFSSRQPFDWVNEKYQILGRHIVGDLNKIRGKLDIIENEHDVFKKGLDFGRNENRVLRERLESLEQTLNLDQANLDRLPRTEEVRNHQRQSNRLEKTSAPSRSHPMVLRSQGRNTRKTT